MREAAASHASRARRGQQRDVAASIGSSCRRRGLGFRRVWFITSRLPAQPCSFSMASCQRNSLLVAEESLEHILVAPVIRRACRVEAGGADLDQYLVGLRVFVQLQQRVTHSGRDLFGNSGSC